MCQAEFQAFKGCVQVRITGQSRDIPQLTIRKLSAVDGNLPLIPNPRSSIRAHTDPAVHVEQPIIIHSRPFDRTLLSLYIFSHERRQPRLVTSDPNLFLLRWPQQRTL